MSLEKVPKAAWAGAGVLLVAIIVVVVVLASGSSSSGDSVELNGSGSPGISLDGTRHVTQSPIDSSTVSGLEEAWSLPAEAKSSYGAYSSTPVVAKGVIYMQDLESNVQAINLENGDVIWSKKYSQPDQGPNGVSVVEGMVFGATPTNAFALDQETGEQLWSVKLTKGVESIDMPVGAHDETVYVSTVPTNVSSSYPAGGVGVLYALEAKTGKERWHFNTVPPSLWGDKSVNAGGGVWYEPTFDLQTNDIYFGVGNPVPFPGAPGKPWGSSRPGPNLYTNSIVKLKGETGELDWYYQLTPHDVYDWDLQDPPMLVKSGGRELAIGAGKSGIVVALDSDTGKLIWKTPVGKHNGHDEDGLLAMRGEFSKLKGGTVYPGTLGGVIAPMASDGKTVFVPVVNHALTVNSAGTEIGEGGGTGGEIDAVDVATGKIKWKHELPSAAFGAPVVVNDVVFASTYEGSVIALDAKTGAELWVTTLPAGINGGLTVSGDTLLVPAGATVAEGQTPELVAYRLGG
ncbi:MAG TPA: PQQ-binding-like beta-propeller repeat protein [Solirubrobacterales bacterium]|nr:PQQ-binding-like beta-propeller repeat protein [Solirubrobacterales bacterium]